MRKIVFLLLSLLILMGMNGCMTSNKTNEAEMMKTVALEYLNKNYEDSFTALGYSDNSWAYDYSVVNFKSNKYSDNVSVRIYDKNGIKSFTDDYFKLSMKEDAENYFEAIATAHGYAAETKVRFLSSTLPSDMDNHALFSDYVASGKCNIEVYFIFNSPFSKKAVSEILSEICAAKIMGNIKFVVTSDKELLSQYSIDEIINLQNSKVLDKQSYSISSDFTIID